MMTVAVITMVAMSVISVPFRAAAAVPSIIPMASIVLMTILHAAVFYMVVLYRVIALHIHGPSRSEIGIWPVAVIAYRNMVQTTDVITGVNSRQGCREYPVWPIIIIISASLGVVITVYFRNVIVTNGMCICRWCPNGWTTNMYG